MRAPMNADELEMGMRRISGICGAFYPPSLHFLAASRRFSPDFIGVHRRSSAVKPESIVG
jgi:hypothetical protein